MGPYGKVKAFGEIHSGTEESVCVCVCIGGGWVGGRKCSHLDHYNIRLLGKAYQSPAEKTSFRIHWQGFNCNGNEICAHEELVRWHCATVRSPDELMRGLHGAGACDELQQPTMPSEPQYSHTNCVE